MPNRSLAASGVGTPRQRVNTLMWRLQSDLGLTANQAAGIASNLYAESGILPVHEKGKPWDEGGINIAQWTGPRRKAFEAWAKSHGMDPMSEEAGVQYFEYSLTNNHPDVLEAVKRSTSAKQAATAFLNYENPAAQYRGAHLANAEGFAKEYTENVPLVALNKEAAQQTARLESARYVSNASDVVVASFRRVGGAADDLAGAFARLNAKVTAAEHLSTLREPAVPPGPWTRVPNDPSNRVTK